jgi:cell division control protein 6
VTSYSDGKIIKHIHIPTVMSVFDNILNSDKTLFKNVDALDFNFTPKIIPFRENEQRKIAESIQPLFTGKNGKNLFVFGIPSEEKTLAVRSVLSELESKTDSIVPIYINCWQKNNSNKVALELSLLMGFTPKSIRAKEIFKEIIPELNKKSIVFVFDEIDKVEDYYFLNEIVEKIERKCIILISSFGSFLDEIDKRIKSQLDLETIEFKPYNLEETKAILKQRLEMAFFPNIWDDNAVELLAKKAAELQDIRVGIQLLKDSGDIAENKGSRNISIEHAREALRKMNEIFKDGFFKGDFDILEGTMGSEHCQTKYGLNEEELRADFLRLAKEKLPAELLGKIVHFSTCGNAITEEPKHINLDWGELYEALRDYPEVKVNTFKTLKNIPEVKVNIIAFLETEVQFDIDSIAKTMEQFGEKVLAYCYSATGKNLFTFLQFQKQ